MVRVAFSNEPGFVASLDKASRRFLNANAVAGNLEESASSSSSKSPELLARYCDQLLKKGGKSATDVDVEKMLDDILIVFKVRERSRNCQFWFLMQMQYIEEKDVFLHFFSKMMAKRLINETSASEDLEASMISKLKSVSGFEYTTKLQRMIQDVGTSRELTQKFSAAAGRQFSIDGEDGGILLFSGHIVCQDLCWCLQLARGRCNCLRVSLLSQHSCCDSKLRLMRFITNSILEGSWCGFQLIPRFVTFV